VKRTLVFGALQKEKVTAAQTILKKKYCKLNFTITYMESKYNYWTN